MNIPPLLLRDPEFLILRDKLGYAALHALVATGTAMQSRKTTRLKIPSKRHLGMTCDTPDVDPDALWDALIPQWLVPVGNDEFEFPLFAEHNTQLLTNWANGARAREKATQRQLNSNATETNSSQPNSTQSNVIQINSTQLNSDATSMPPLSQGSAKAEPPCAW